MKELSLVEKFQILFNNIIAHPFFLIILIVPMAVMFLERDTTKKEKDVKKIILLIYIIVIGVVLFIGGSTLFELFDNVMNGLFMALYFPNFITLFIVIIISAVICLTTVFHKKMRKSIRITNFTGFAIVQTMFCFVLMAVKSNDINIYKENALYSNDDVLTLMQLLMGAFLLQIITVCVITLINRITEMLDERDNILKDQIKATIDDKDIINNEIKKQKNKKPVVLQAKVIQLNDLSVKEKNKDNEKKQIETLDLTEKMIKSKDKTEKIIDKPNKSINETLALDKVNKIVEESPVLDKVNKIVEESPVLNQANKFINETPVLKPLNKIVEEKPVLEDLNNISPLVSEIPNKVNDVSKKSKNALEEIEDFRNVVLTISNLNIVKSKESLSNLKKMKYYKKKIFYTYAENQIENLRIIDFKLAIRVLKNIDKKKIRTYKI